MLAHSVNKIFLCGFMGSGKSTLLKKISASGFELIDLDMEILSKSSHSSLWNLIEEIGWESFRDLEYSHLKELLLKKEKILVALGGGAFGERFQALLRESQGNFTIWLNTPLEECLKRISSDENRPLVKKGQDYLRELYNQRLDYYKKCDFVLNQNEQEMIKSVEDLISLIPSK